MKKGILAILILPFILLLPACNKKQANETFSPPDLFAAKNYSVIPEMQGKLLEGSPVTVDYQTYLQMIQNPITFSNWLGYDELIARDKRFISFNVFNKQTTGDVDTGYSWIPQQLSENLLFKRINRSSSILVDKTNGIVLFFSDGENAGGRKVIDAIQLTSRISFESLNVVCGSDKQAVFTLEGHYLYILDLATMRVESYADTGDWKVMAGDFDEEKLFLFEYNKTESRLREVEYFSGKTVADHSLAGTPIKGEILCIAPDEPLGTYILTKDGDDNHIYESQFESFDYFITRSTDNEGKPLKGINEIYVEYTAGLEHPVGYIVYLDKDNPYPVQSFYYEGAGWSVAG